LKSMKLVSGTVQRGGHLRRGPKTEVMSCMYQLNKGLIS
jgi:hypothetical protein